jgi:NADH-quinone oxidoreductase subunit I
VHRNRHGHGARGAIIGCEDGTHVYNSIANAFATFLIYPVNLSLSARQLLSNESWHKWLGKMLNWLRNVWLAISTVGRGMWVTLSYWFKTYRPDRGTFTQKFEYPEKPVPVAARYRGFHRFDLTTCIACDQCAKACPVDCIYIGKERVKGGKGFRVTGYAIDYSKCMFCALCVEPCPVDCIFMGATHDLSCYSRDGCIVDYSRLPVEIAWGRATLNPEAVAKSKVITEPVNSGPNQ